MSNDVNDISAIAKHIKQDIDSRLGNYRVLHHQSQDVSYGLGFHIDDIVQQALEHYLITKKPKKNTIAKIPLTPLENPYVFRVRHHDGSIDCYIRDSPNSNPGRLIHPHEWTTFCIQDDLRLANQRSLRDSQCSACETLFLKQGIWNTTPTPPNSVKTKDKAQPDKKDVINVLLGSIKQPKQKVRRAPPNPVTCSVEQITTTDEWPGIYWLEMIQRDPHTESNEENTQDAMDRARKWKTKMQKELDIADDQSFNEYIQKLKTDLFAITKK